MNDISTYLERLALHSADRLAPYVLRPSNPVTGAAIAQHPVQPIAPPPPPVIGPGAGSSVGATVTPAAATAGSTTVVSVPSTVRQPFYNVLDYGADGTGVADSTTAIQAAIAAANAAGGGVVWFPAGSYKCNLVLNNVNNVILQGASGYGTFLNSSSSTASTVLLSGSTTGNIQVNDFFINGPATTGACLDVNVPSVSLFTLSSRNLYLVGGGYGLRISNNNSSIFYNLQCYENLIDGVLCDGTGNSAANQSVTNVFIYGFQGQNTVAGVSNASAIHLRGINGFRLSGGDYEVLGAAGSTGNVGIRIDPPSTKCVVAVTFEAFTIYAVWGDGIALAGATSGNGISDVSFVRCSSIGDGTHTLHGISVGGNVSSLHLTDFKTASLFNSGIILTGPASGPGIDDVQIIGGQHIGNGGSGIYIPVATVPTNNIRMSGITCQSNAANGFTIDAGAGTATNWIIIGNTSLSNGTGAYAVTTGPGALMPAGTNI